MNIALERNIAINSFELYISDIGITVLKLYVHVLAS